MKPLFSVSLVYPLSLVSYAWSAKHATARVIEMQNAKLFRIALVSENGERQVIPLQVLKLLGANDQVLMDNEKLLMI